MSPLFLLFALFIHQSVFAARTGTYQFQSNGVICSPDFGAPLLEDCNRALVVLANRKYKNDAQRWFVSSLDTSIKEDHEVLPYSASSGTCVIDLDISPGARNRVAGSTLTSIAQSVISTCTSPTIFQGGWGAYADIAIVISSPSSPFRSPEERDPEHTSPVLNSTDSTAARSGSAQELAFFRGSFWARGLVMINFPRLPGFAVTEQWQYPASVYQVYDETESAHCENGVEITENDPKCACCSSSKCANRLIDGTGAVEARCVWLGGGVALRKFVKSDAFINSTGVDTLVTEYNVEDKTGLTRRKKKRRSRKNHTM